MSTSGQTLQQFVERARHLDSLPSVAREVLELTAHPQIDLPALKDCIEQDPALSAKILRVVNTSLFGLNREVSDLQQALSLVGIKSLKTLVLGFSLSDAVFSKFTGKVCVRYWRRALARAVAAREIAQTICRVPGDEPYAAALLQDIGVLVLLEQAGEPYAKLLNRSHATRAELCAREVSLLGFDHRELTTRLLKTWGLPPTLVAAIEMSYGPHEDADAPRNAGVIARIVNLAALLSDLLVEGSHELVADSLDLGPHCRVNPAQLSELTARVQEKLNLSGEVFSLDLPRGTEYRDLLVQAHARMSETAAELAAEQVRRSRPRAAQFAEAAETLADVQAMSTAVSKFIQRPPVDEAPPRERVTPTHAASHTPPTPNIEGNTTTPQTAGGLKIEGEEGLLSRLALITYACRQSRRALSLVLVEIDQFPQLILKHGPQQAARFARLVHDACARLEIAQASCVPMTQYCFAVALPDCDRHQAAKLCNQLIQEVRGLAATEAGAATSPLAVSVGLASVDVPSKNFQPIALVESATRCLSAAQLSGGQYAEEHRDLLSGACR